MKQLSTLTLAAALALAPAWAGAWRATNWHEVLPVSNGVYEVVARVGSGPADYWCGAGEYFSSQLGVPATQRIYVWRGIGPSVNRPGRKAVQFSLTPPPGADLRQRLTLDVKEPGDSINAAMAKQYCYNRDNDFFIWP
ncbi:hypothetical protein [Seohaeicola zhoushanensis]|nr:hypothetical protein [Seohaeicola zhoushanensis]